MARDLIVSSNPRETRVALLEDGLVAELFLEREAQRGIVGSIYKGRITRVAQGSRVTDYASASSATPSCTLPTRSRSCRTTS